MSLDAYRELNIRHRSDLDQLPWFEKDDGGENRIKPDAGVPPVLDVHAHVGWSYGWAAPIAYAARTDVQYFFDYERDQDVLFDRCHPLPDEAKKIGREMNRAMFKLGAMSATHTASNLADEMDRFNVRHTCLLPIEIPIGSRHASDTMNAAGLDQRLIPFAAVHPWRWGAFQEARLAKQIAQGARAVKFHPEFQFIAADNPHAMKLFEWCALNKVPMLAHCGYTGREPKWLRKKSEPDRFREALSAFPDLQLLLAHVGLSRRTATLEVARAFPNQVWLDISGQAAGGVRATLDHYDRARICYGSDWPFYPMDVAMARTLAGASDLEEYWPDLFYNNAARFLGMPALT